MMMDKFAILPALRNYDFQKGLAYGYFGALIPIGLLHYLKVRVPPKIRMYYPEIILGSSILGGIVNLALAQRRHKKALQEAVERRRKIVRALMTNRPTNLRELYGL